MWNLKKINYICRIVEDENGKFKFDVMLRTEILVTDGKIYEKYEDATKALNEYLNKLYIFEKDTTKHLIVNDTE